MLADAFDGLFFGHSIEALALNITSAEAVTTSNASQIFACASAEKKTGRDEILDYIEQQNAEVADLMNRSYKL